MPAGEGSVRLVYDAGGTRHDAREGVIKSGQHGWLAVRGPDRVLWDVDSAGLLHPPFLLMVLAGLCFPAGAVYTFLGCVMAVEARVRRLASKVS
jgi:hypothetical protein